MTELLGNPEPTFKIDGQPQGALTRDAIELSVEESVEGLRTLQLSLLAFGPKEDGTGEGLLYLDGPPLTLGAKVEVTLGSGDEAQVVFTGKVSAVEGSFDSEREPKVEVFAEDALMQLRMTRRCKTYEKTSDEKLAESVGQAHQLQVSTKAPGPTYDVVQQWNQSDLAFLRERARLIQAELWVKDDTLHFATRPNRVGQQVELTLGVDLLRLDVRADLAHQRSSVSVSGYDAKKREGFTKQAGNEAIQAEAPKGKTGPQAVAALGNGLASLRVREAPLSQGEADAWAKAELLRRARQFVVALGTTRGTPTLDVGSRVKLVGAGNSFSGDGYYVTSVRHSWSRSEGFRTHFEAERGTLNEEA
ncbi:MAG: contractile injection system protein, VgrG/Pvc8 family [Myxococcaceae bacterium]